VRMATSTTIPKAQKSKTNNFISILGQIPESIICQPDQLSKHVSDLGASLLDWKACKCVKDVLTRRSFSKEQIVALIFDKRNENLPLGKWLKWPPKVVII